MVIENKFFDKKVSLEITKEGKKNIRKVLKVMKKNNLLLYDTSNLNQNN